MGLIQSLAMLVIIQSIHGFTLPNSSESSTREAKASLDALLQDYAYRALVNPKTGAIYDGAVPSNLSGIKIAALRLRSDSLWRKGYKMYKEFEIPIGIVETPYVERLIFVYQNLGNWSTTFYQLPNYTYLAPVVGLLAYDGSNLSARNLGALNIGVSGDPILVRFDDVKSAPEGTIAKCVWFDLQGSSNFSNVTGGNTCSSSQQGHFSIVVQFQPTGRRPRRSFWDHLEYYLYGILLAAVSIGGICLCWHLVVVQL